MSYHLTPEKFLRHLAIAYKKQKKIDNAFSYFKTHQSQTRKMQAVHQTHNSTFTTPMMAKSPQLNKKTGSNAKKPAPLKMIRQEISDSQQELPKEIERIKELDAEEPIKNGIFSKNEEENDVGIFFANPEKESRQKLIEELKSNLSELEKKYAEMLANKYYEEFDKEMMESLAEKIQALKQKLDISSH